jgi:putative transposase
MGHTFYSVYEHIAFSTKHRRRMIDPTAQGDLFAYLAAAVRNQGCRAITVGGHVEHVHLLVLKSSTLLTGELVKEIKRTSSIWMKGKVKGFSWQAGYGAFSVSSSNLPSVQRYILGQARRHRKMTWEEEYRLLLEKHGIQFDERYFLD